MVIVKVRFTLRVAIDNTTKVKNIILMGTLAQNPVKVIYYNQVVSSPSEYATQVLDKNHTGLISIQQLGIGPIQQYVLADLYSWLEAHSGLSHSYATITTITSHMAASFSRNTTSNFSSSSD